MKLWIGLLWLLLLPLSVASAHSFDPTVITLQEEQPGRFRVEQILPPNVASSESMIPRFPAHCQLRAEPTDAADVLVYRLDCGALGLRGQQLAVTGPAIAEALVTIHFLDGDSLSTLLHQEPLQIPNPRQSLRLPTRHTIQRFLPLGFRHILSGADHLLLLLGLLLLTDSVRRLLWTVTAFTVGHSVTLALSTLEVVQPPSLLVEALIALSVVFLAREILRPPICLARHRPALLAMVFGLLHGLGFASALREVGLPQDQLPVSLLSFNCGVELGQLLFVLALLLPVRILRRLRLAPLLGYALGSVAMTWTIERCLLLFRSA